MASHGITRVAGSQTRSDQAREKELQHIARYNDLVELVNTKIAERQYTVEVLNLTTKLVTENPEYYTIWNHRRRVLQELFPSQAEPSSTDSQQQILNLITTDLRLTTSLLRQFPKCYWLWNHRYWALQAGESRLDADAASKLWQGELQLVTMMLGADSRNFHAWSYRRFVVNQIERISLSPDWDNTSTHNQSMVEAEFAYTTKMINANLSNFSAWHNRSKLIPRLLNERQSDRIARRRMLDEEFALIHEAFLDPFDQSIWYYHQYLMSTLSPHIPRESAIMLDLTEIERKHYCEQEVNFIRDILEDEEDCKWIYEVLLGYSALYPSLTSSDGVITNEDIREWLSQLKRLDPFRKGRWADFERSLAV